MERIQEKAGLNGGRVEARAKDTQGYVLKAGRHTVKLSKMTLELPCSRLARLRRIRVK